MPVSSCIPCLILILWIQFPLLPLFRISILSLSLSIFLLSDNLSFTSSISSPTHFLTSSSIVVSPNFTIFRVTRLTVSLSSLPLNNSSRLSTCILISTRRHLSSPLGLPILIFLSLSLSPYLRFLLLFPIFPSSLLTSSRPHVFSPTCPPFFRAFIFPLSQFCLLAPNFLSRSTLYFPLSTTLSLFSLHIFFPPPSLSLYSLSSFSLSLPSYTILHYPSLFFYFINPSLYVLPIKRFHD